MSNAWTVVPGGWSVGVEFTFYMVFPAFAALVGTWRRAVLLSVAALAVAYASRVALEPWLAFNYGKTASETFLFFWFLHQCPVFALGAVLYHALFATWRAPQNRTTQFLRRYGVWVALGCVGACILAATLPFPGRMPPTPPLYVPRLYLASGIFMVLALALGNAKSNPLNNRWIRSLGKVSFSAYPLHFAVLALLQRELPGVFDTSATGYGAIAEFARLYAAAVLVTYVLALLTFRTIERPMINVGRTVIWRDRARGPSRTSLDRPGAGKARAGR